MFVAGIVWILGDLLGAAAFFSGNPINNTGNIAHLIGMFVGLIYGMFLRKNYKQNTIKKPNVYINEYGMRRWEDVYMR
jgi:membrane associated rhomboid family serine protease